MQGTAGSTREGTREAYLADWGDALCHHNTHRRPARLLLQESIAVEGSHTRGGRCRQAALARWKLMMATGRDRCGEQRLGWQTAGGWCVLQRSALACICLRLLFSFLFLPSFLGSNNNPPYGIGMSIT